MRVSTLVIGAMLTLGVCVARAGLPLITIDPNYYAAGQLVTDPTGEGQFNALSAYLNPDPTAPADQAYILQSSPVFAPGGNTFGVWGNSAAAAACGSLMYCNPISANDFLPGSVLEISFTQLTNFVAAQIAFNPIDPDGGWIQAFNSAGQTVGYCGGDINGIGGSPGNVDCGSYPDPSNLIWPQYSITDSNRDISYVLIGGNANQRPVGKIQYSLPEPGPFGLLALGVAAIAFSTRRRRAARAR